MLNEFYKLHGIIHETTATYSSKIKNRISTELIVAIMLNSGTTSYWHGKYY